MTNAFKAGDIVVCINTRPNPVHQPDPAMLRRLREGAYYRVAAYLPPPGQAGLQLVGVDHAPGDGWQAERFRKIEPADPHFIALITKRELQDA
jgi:hypothetical protein